MSINDRIPLELAQAFESQFRNIRAKVSIDWNNDDTFEDVTNDLEDFSISKKAEGNFGVSVKDTLSLTLSNHHGYYSPKNAETPDPINGNVLPKRKIKTEIGSELDDQTTMLIPTYEGYIHGFDNNNNLSYIKSYDYVDVLQKTTVPEQLFINGQTYTLDHLEVPETFNILTIENLCKALINHVNSLGHNIIIGKLPKCSMVLEAIPFEGQQTVWSVFQKLSEIIWGYCYFEGNVFYFESKLDENFVHDTTSKYTFATIGNDNIFNTPREIYNADKVRTAVNLKMNPYYISDRQKIWIMPASTIPVEIEYHWNEHSEFYGTDNGRPYIKLYDVKGGDTSPTLTYNVPILTPNNDDSEDEKKAKLSVLFFRNNSIQEYWLGSGIDEVDSTDGIIHFSWDTDSFPTPTDGEKFIVRYNHYNDMIRPDMYKDYLIELDYYVTGIENVIFKQVAFNAGQLEIGEQILISTNPDGSKTWKVPLWGGDVPESAGEHLLYTLKTSNNGKKIELRIVNNFRYEVWLGASDNDDTYSGNVYIMGKPVIQKEKPIEYRPRSSENIRNNFGEESINIDTIFINSTIYMQKLGDFLLYEYETPKSEIKFSAPALPHLKLFDRITVIETHRDIDKDFIVTAIKLKYAKNEFVMDIDAVQADTTPFTFEGGLAKIELPQPKDILPIYGIPPANVTNLNLNAGSLRIDGINRINLSWTNPSDISFAGVRIYRKKSDETIWRFITQLPKSNTIFEDTTLEYEGTYTYAVTSIDSAYPPNETLIKDAPQQTINIIDQANPSNVTTLTYESQYGNIVLNWQYPSPTYIEDERIKDFIVEYTIERREYDGEGNVIIIQAGKDGNGDYINPLQKITPNNFTSINVNVQTADTDETGFYIYAKVYARDINNNLSSGIEFNNGNAMKPIIKVSKFKQGRIELDASRLYSTNSSGEVTFEVDAETGELGAEIIGARHIKTNEISSELIKVGHQLLLNPNDFYLPFNQSLISSKGILPVDSKATFIDNGLYDGAVGFYESGTNLLSVLSDNYKTNPIGVFTDTTNIENIGDYEFKITDTGDLIKTIKDIPVEALAIYNFGLEVKGTEKIKVYLEPYDSNDTLTGTPITLRCPVNEEYTLYSVGSGFPVNTVKLKIKIECNETWLNGISYIKNMVLVENDYYKGFIDGTEETKRAKYNKKLSSKGSILLNFKYSTEMDIRMTNGLLCYLMSDSNNAFIIRLNNNSLQFYLPHENIATLINSSLITWVQGDWYTIGLSWDANQGIANIYLANKSDMSSTPIISQQVNHTCDCIFGDELAVGNSYVYSDSNVAGTIMDDIVYKDNQCLTLADFDALRQSYKPYIDPQSVVTGAGDGFLVTKNRIIGMDDYRETFSITNRGEFKDAKGYTIIDINGNATYQIVKIGFLDPIYDENIINIGNITIPENYILTFELTESVDAFGISYISQLIPEDRTIANISIEKYCYVSFYNGEPIHDNWLGNKKLSPGTYNGLTAKLFHYRKSRIDFWPNDGTYALNQKGFGVFYKVILLKTN